MVKPEGYLFYSDPGEGGVLPCKGLMGTCGQPGYVFRDFVLTGYQIYNFLS